MKKLLFLVVVLAVVIQFVPYGHDHTNPPVKAEPTYSSPEAADLYHRACYNCHSNETTWPWYSNVAPVGWLVQYDVDGGRRHMNFTEWDTAQRHAKDIADEVQSGAMPPWWYLPMHPEARLTAQEKQALVAAAPASK